MVPLLALPWLESKQKTLSRPMLASAGFCPPHLPTTPGGLATPATTNTTPVAGALSGTPAPTATSPLGGKPLLLPGQTSSAPTITSVCFLSPQRTGRGGRMSGAHCSHGLFLLPPAPVLTAVHPKVSRPGTSKRKSGPSSHYHQNRPSVGPTLT